MSVSRFFIFDKIKGTDISCNEFEITGSTSELIGEMFILHMARSLKMATILLFDKISTTTTCIMCNDSVINFNEFKQLFEKVGEATKTALTLIVLAEKMSPCNVTKTGLGRHSAAIAVRQDIKAEWRKEFSRDRKSMSSFCIRLKPSRIGIGPNIFFKGAHTLFTF
jgi:Ca2+ transporting ATPase